MENILKKQSWLLVLCGLLMWLPLPNAHADLSSLLKQNTATQFLPVAQAFQFRGEIKDGKLTIFATVTPEHYLYKHQFDFQGATGLTVSGVPNYPAADTVIDPFYNKEMEVFKHDVNITVPANATDTLPEVTIGFQGCSEAGLCYPPETITIPVAVQPNSVVDSKIVVAVVPEVTPAASLQPSQQLDHSTVSITEASSTQMVRDSLLATLLFALIAGMGLSLTPCVLPMVPILSSLILGQQHLSKRRSLTLTLSYILSMSVTFAAAGTLMGLFGAELNLQARLQSSWLLIPMALLFVVLSLSMFGLFEIQLPERLRSKLMGSSSSQSGGSLFGAMVMGALSALVVSPCVSAPLAGLLIYISTTGDALLGSLALFALGLGMGLPLLLMALGGRQWLPKSGTWMNGVRGVFGVLLLGVAIWMLERVIPASATMVLWSVLLVGCAVFLGALRTDLETISQKINQTVGILCLVYGACLLIGAAMGNSNPLQPLSIQRSADVDSIVPHSAFTKVTTVQELEALLVQAKQTEQSVMVDLYADWCISCKVMEREVFPDPLLAQAFSDMRLVKFDITANTTEQRAFMDQHQLFGSPALLFYNVKGDIESALTVQGEVSAAQLLQVLNKLI